MTSCKDPELRRQVREQLLYKPKPPEGITPGQVAALRRLFRRGQSVPSLSRRFGMPEDAIRYALTAEAAEVYRVELEKIVERYAAFTNEELAELWSMAIAHNDLPLLKDLAMVRRWREGKYR